MYYIYGVSVPSLLIESTDSMIGPVPRAPRFLYTLKLYIYVYMHSVLCIIDLLTLAAKRRRRVTAIVWRFFEYMNNVLLS